MNVNDVYYDIKGCPKKIYKKAEKAIKRIKVDRDFCDFYAQLIYDADLKRLELKTFNKDYPIDYQTFSETEV